MRGRLFSIACSLVLVVAVSHAQRAPASIRGRVVAAENDRALPRARLVVTADGRAVDAVFTDDRGRFSISIPAGSNVALSVTKAGYAVEQVAVPSTTTPGELAIRLSRSVAISGRVTDPSGEGAVDVRVIAQRQDLVEEGRGPSASRFETTTDDLGDYRLGGLPAGNRSADVLEGRAQARAVLTVAVAVDQALAVRLFGGFVIGHVVGSFEDTPGPDRHSGVRRPLPNSLR